MKKKLIDANYHNRIKGLFYSKTDEKNIQLSILEYLLDGRQYRHSLDIGCGDGTLSEPFSRRSSEITLVEILDSNKRELENKYPHADILNADFRDLTFTNYFDAIHFSHCIYYISECSWLPTIEKLIALLNKKGELYVVLNRDEGDWWDIVNKYFLPFREKCNMHYIPASEFSRQIKKRWFSEYYFYSSSVAFDSLKEMCDFISGVVLQIRDEKFIHSHQKSIEETAMNIANKNSGMRISVESMIIKITRLK
ncbi:TPA: class I SAM-dependent methyltransferase [Enterobacter asburiae]